MHVKTEIFFCFQSIIEFPLRSSPNFQITL